MTEQRIALMMESFELRARGQPAGDVPAEGKAPGSGEDRTGGTDMPRGNRWKSVIAYDGAAFHGFQRQDNAVSVQQCLEEALARFCQHPVSVHGAGRTDAGVHATGQVVHFDVPDSVLTRDRLHIRLRDGVNFYLRGSPLAVLETMPAAADFHARFSARSRVYRYRILNRPAPPVLEAGLVWHIPRPLHEKRMRDAAAYALGTHDFSSLRGPDCQARSPVKTLDRLDVTRIGEEIIIEASARSFLHRQVRNLVGTLRLFSEKNWPAAQMKEILNARRRDAAGPTAPACGLCLVNVLYD